MEETKRKKLDELVGKLGMSQSLAALLDSDESYERFEGAVEDCLKEYLDGKKAIIDIVDYRKVHSSPSTSEIVGCYGSPRISPKPKIERIEHGRSIPIKLIEYFKRNYGIGCEPKSSFEIAQEEFGEWVEPKGLSKFERTRNRRNYSSKIGEVHQVVKFLKQKHKSDIWYGAL